MQDETIPWTYDRQPFPVAATRAGSGPKALLLPALSSISTRAELSALQAILSERFETLAIDWPGFGTAPKARADWTPAALADALGAVLAQEHPALIVAAGHAAGLVLRHVAAEPSGAPRLVLIAPTWRGPLPTMMGRRAPWLGRIVRAVDAAVIGPVIYGLNLSRPVIGMMARGHVYSAPDWLSPARMAAKGRVARARGARFASIRFVTGALDPFTDADAFRSAARAVPKGRLQLIWGAETPPKSRAEMEALADATGVDPTILPRGKLGLHEEFPVEAAAAILAHLPDDKDL